MRKKRKNPYWTEWDEKYYIQRTIFDQLAEISGGGNGESNNKKQKEEKVNDRQRTF